MDPNSPLVQSNEWAKKLNELMADPHPGLHTWCKAVQHVMVNLHIHVNKWMEN